MSESLILKFRIKKKIKSFDDIIHTSIKKIHKQHLNKVTANATRNEKIQPKGYHANQLTS